MTKKITKSLDHEPLLTELQHLIDKSRQKVALAVNAELTMLYWKIGHRINVEILKNNRAEYGQFIIQSLSRSLTTEYGRSFEAKNLRRMIQFAETFSDEKIVAALRRQLSWTHFKLLIPLKDPLKRDFYAEMCRIEHWTTRTLDKQNEPPRGKPRGIRGGVTARFPTPYLDFLHSARPPSSPRPHLPSKRNIHQTKTPHPTDLSSVAGTA